MFNRYLIIKNGNNEDLYLYINNYTEFSNDLTITPNNVYNLKEKIGNYIRGNNIKFNGQKIFLVLNGIIISYILLSDIKFNNKLNPKVKYIEYLKNIDIKEDDVDIELINELIDSTKDININYLL